MRRLYWRIYAGFVLVVVLFALFVALLGRVAGPPREREQWIEGVAATVADLLPAEGVPQRQLEQSLRALSRRFRAHATLYARDGLPLAVAGPPVPPPPREPESRWVRGLGGRAFALALPDGRWLVVRHRPRRGPPLLGFLHRSWPWLVAALALAIALVAHPLARRITRRLERLQTRVDALGAGNLSVRVDVEGRDEVAELARSFNRSAERIEALVEAQRSTLASASHELRSPLTRIRMAVELLAEDPRAELKDAISRDIQELDDLIEELLLASRLNAGRELTAEQPVQLDELLREEAKRVGARCEAETVTLSGSPRLLRRLLRNLLENAVRHGKGAAVDARLVVDASRQITLLVEDRGPGIAEDIRERIFEPFFRPPGMREGEDRGVGLGLALVRQIARHHGGEASYEPRDGGGSRFKVTLALQPAD